MPKKKQDKDDGLELAGGSSSKVDKPESKSKKKSSKKKKKKSKNKPVIW